MLTTKKESGIVLTRRNIKSGFRYVQHRRTQIVCFFRGELQQLQSWERSAPGEEIETGKKTEEVVYNY
jgi:hypothetical protein